jgi:hypothetical protein
MDENLGDSVLAEKARGISLTPMGLPPPEFGILKGLLSIAQLGL